MMATHTDTHAPTEPARLADLLAVPGSWSREARYTLWLARERGLCLSDERLIYSDVRDLVTLQRLLRETARPSDAPRALRDYLCA